MNCPYGLRALRALAMTMTNKPQTETGNYMRGGAHFHFGAKTTECH